MPEAEPSSWELMRAIRSVDAKVDNVVTKDMFQAESRRVDERLAEQARDIADEQTARVKADEQERSARKEDVGKVATDLATFKKEVADTAEKNRANMRWLVAAILVPVGLAIFGLLNGGGG